MPYKAAVYFVGERERQNDRVVTIPHWLSRFPYLLLTFVAVVGMFFAGRNSKLGRCEFLGVTP